KAPIRRAALCRQHLLGIIKKFSVFDLAGWGNCVLEYEKYYAFAAQPEYHSWLKEGGGTLQYGVIPWKLPANAKIGLIADWATGEPESIAVLKAVCSYGPDVILNLGDTYYSGTYEECRDNIILPLSKYAINPTSGKKIPV